MIDLHLKIWNHVWLNRCWRLFMIKLWNHGLLDGRTMNRCNITLEQHQKQVLDPVKSQERWSFSLAIREWKSKEERLYYDVVIKGNLEGPSCFHLVILCHFLLMKLFHSNKCFHQIWIIKVMRIIDCLCFDIWSLLLLCHMINVLITLLHPLICGDEFHGVIFPCFLTYSHDNQMEI